jgi:uncharacterized protein (UPF0335 family)
MTDEFKSLKDQIERLEKENRVLFDAITLVSDFASGIMLSLKADEKIEAFKKAEKLNIYALNAMSKAKGGPEIKIPE